MNTAISAAAISVGDKYVPIRYIGKKPNKKDVVLGRRLEWKGYGDVKWVPEKDAAVYVTYPDIWEVAQGLDVPEGGIMGLSQLTAAASPPPSDLKSTSPLPRTLNRAPDAAFESDAKVAAMADSVAAFASSAVAENLTLETAMAKLTKIMQAIPKLKPGDFDPTGKPKATALLELMGVPVSRVERDIAYNMLKKKMAELHEKVMKEEGGSSTADAGEGESEEGAPATTSVKTEDLVP